MEYVKRFGEPEKDEREEHGDDEAFQGFKQSSIIFESIRAQPGERDSESEVKLKGASLN